MTAVEYSPPASLPGTAVTFAAMTTIPVIDYDWDFGGGATPQHSTDATPVVTLRNPGWYTGSVQVSTADRTSARYRFEYGVQAPPPPIPEITQVTPTGDVGTIGQRVTFAAEAVWDNGTFDWTWEFSEAVQILPTPFADRFAEVRLLEPGTHTARVSASNESGTSEPFEFSFTVTTPPPLAWTHHEIVRDVLPSTCSVAVVAGRPAVAFRTGAGYHYAGALTPEPESPADWQIHLFHLTDGRRPGSRGTGRPGWPASRDVPGRRRGGFLDCPGAVPATAAGWGLAPVPAGPPAPYSGQAWNRNAPLQVRNGRLESFHAGLQGALHWRAEVPEPGDATDWHVYSCGGPTLQYNTPIRPAVLAGRPAFIALTPTRAGMRWSSSPPLLSRSRRRRPSGTSTGWRAGSGPHPPPLQSRRTGRWWQRRLPMFDWPGRW
ncbi:MAG TPA: hypothetical protein VEI97_14860 [bacterium]|nr:hypothetical protein [bacterium]